ncbi:tetratricopeptide repeat protein [Winogradskyella sp. A3E31]|uniref:tetratricopeptide repeat protein n=1 Tax=Winogradskyella sp. A3E31 TaxID=3349637 RepID=UPI00398AEA50
MKKLVTIIGALLIGFSSFGQKDEMKALEKALKRGEYANAKAAAMSADALVGNMDDKTKAEFYFLKAQAMYANGQGSAADMDVAIESIDKVREIESMMGKDKYTEEANEMRTGILQAILRKADNALQSKSYAMASKNFNKAYKLSPKDSVYLYYAASTAVNVPDYDSALEYYLKLKGMGYSGATTQYIATNTANGQEVTFNSKKELDNAIKLPLYENPEVVKVPSKSAEIVKNIALIYVAQDDNEKALEFMAEARQENPDDLGLLLSEANVHLKMGNKEKFKELMEEATKQDPNNAELQYNLGVLAAEGGNNEAAQKYYEKAIAINPQYTDAYTNMAVSILAREQVIVEEMNGLGTSSADNKRYDELKDERTEVYKKAIPYLEKALDLKKNNIDAARTLMNIYSAIGETEKFKAMKTRVADMEANSGN